ncbi:MAG: hypothetical protein Q4B26_18280, partial [Eubacteriales bacterium]|nr:hypothetical protein [Eubacteriales bacterium]
TYMNGERKLIFRRQIGSLWKIEKEIPWIEESVTLWVEGDLEFYRFYYKDSSGNSAELGRGETRYLTTEVGGAFTGNYIGLYSVGNGRPCEHEAVFRRYRYCQK